IGARPITVSAVTDSKVYDGTTASAATPSISSGTIAGGDTASFSQTFDTRTVGTGKTLTASGSVLDGNGGDNYDGTFETDTTAAPVILSDGRVPADSVTDSDTAASFADKNVGTGKTVSVSGISISGTDAANYSLLNTTASTSADISPRDLTVSATGINKTYDGTTDATVSLSDDRVAGDSV